MQPPSQATPSPPRPAGAPQLDFSVTGAATLERAATPAIRFALELGAPSGEAIRAVVLETQVQIAARRRSYDDAEEERLFELFGPTDNWGSSLRTLLWARVTQAVPRFAGATEIGIDVPCSYDLEVLGARYLAALDGGEVPLEFMFTGTVFYDGADGRLQTGRIGWDREAEFRMPVAVWRETMDRYFPKAAWVRLGADAFERLAAFKARNAHLSFDDAIDVLLDGVAERPRESR